jgi:nicotinamidase-related amidase
MPYRLDPGAAALLVIDVQRGFDEIEATGLPRNNPAAIQRIEALLTTFRRAGAAIIHVRHASSEPGSPFQPDRPGYVVKDEAKEQAGEAVIVKRVNSAFIGTDLEQRLRAAGIRTLVIAGATTNHCVETTVRMGGNLGFEVLLVRDATWTFDRVGPDGETHRAAAVHAMSLANLSGEFARVVKADQIEAMLDR